MDFQVREPVSPLIGELKDVRSPLIPDCSRAFGQQRHLAYLITGRSIRV